MFPTWNMEHGGILSMPDLKFILIFEQNDAFDHFLIFTPFWRLETLLPSYKRAVVAMALVPYVCFLRVAESASLRVGDVRDSSYLVFWNSKTGHEG